MLCFVLCVYVLQIVFVFFFYEHYVLPFVILQTGVISDDELLDLLDLALSTDTSNTVIRARELVRTRIDPLQLISQLANLIMDILAGKFELGDSEIRRFCNRYTCKCFKIYYILFSFEHISPFCVCSPYLCLLLSYFCCLNLVVLSNHSGSRHAETKSCIKNTV